MKNNYFKTKSNSELQENPDQSKNIWINRQSLVIMVSTFLCFLIILIIVNSEPISEISIFNEKYGAAPISDPHLLSLMEKEAFLQSRLTMANTDSIGITLNLLDSTLCLEIVGVVVHRSKLLKIKKSRFLDKTNEVAKINWIKTPFRIISYEASIPKEPITITKAPKDTIEAAQMNTKIVDTIPEYISYKLLLNKGLLIEISQSNDSLPKWARPTSSFFSKKWDGFKETAGTLFGINEKEFIPYIFVEIPFYEARSIYRAIPENAMVTITY